MQFGVSVATITLDDPLEKWQAYVDAAQDAGFKMLTAGDIMTRNYELYVHMTMLALRSNVRFGPAVSQPVTRHPAVAAAAFGSLQKLSGGRAFYGIATGNNALRNLGLPAAKLDDVREYVECFRTLLRQGKAVYRGRTCNLPWGPSVVPEGVPVYIAADGTKALTLAGQIADGVIVGGGLSREYVEHVRETLDAGALRAGRTLADLDVWFMAELDVATDGRDLASDSLNILSALCSRTFRFTFDGKAVPEELHDALREFNQRYDYSGHITGENAPLVEELGLKEFLADRFLIGGTPDEVVARLRELDGYGVHNLLVPNLTPDPHALLRNFKEHVLPKMGPA